MREAELIARVARYIDSARKVPELESLDGNYDGNIDNLSIIVQGDVDGWGELLWPHMEFFPQDSMDNPVTINGKRVHAFNFEFEGAPMYFTARTFCHEMGHSMGLPDLYHYKYYSNVSPAGAWDLMCSTNNYQQISTMLKSKYLHVAEEPIQITEDGTYTLLSNASSPSQNCYYIKSAIDSTQWFTFEYRNQADVYDSHIPGTGMLIGRWNDTVPITYEGMFANAFFDFYNHAHQYWIFRPGSSCDTVNGNPNQAHFSFASGRTSFGPTTDPHPYLTFLTDEVADVQAEKFSIYPNPAVHQVNVSGENMVSVELYNALGQLIRTEKATTSNFCTMPLNSLSSGVYMLKIVSDDGSTSVQKFVKK